MNDTLKELLLMAMIAAIPACFGMITVVFGYVRAWLEAHTRNQWLLVIEREAFDVVAFVGQTMIDPAKKALADGKLSEDEKNSLKAAALAALEARLRDLPKHLFPDFAGRLGQAIEAAIPQVKAATAPLPASPVSVLPSGQNKPA